MPVIPAGGAETGSGTFFSDLPSAPRNAKPLECGVKYRAAGRHAAQRTEDFRAEDLQLAHEVRQAVGDLVGRRRAVVGRPALQDVRDEDLVARQVDGLDHFRQELSGAADEGECSAAATIPFIFFVWKPFRPTA